MVGTEQSSTEHGSGHGGTHSRFLAHHFADQGQQFDAGKLGMWLFLVQEILFFSGLFCAYSIYRSNHPEIFAYADHFLDRRLGAINTCVLIFSSFTIAWAVRAVQLNQRKLAVTLLGVTFICACLFLGIKFVEYRHKFHDGLLWGHKFAPTAEALETPEVSGAPPIVSPPVDTKSPPPNAGARRQETDALDEKREDAVETHPAAPFLSSLAKAPKNVHIFFGIYFAMTGLHAIHVLIGMGIIIWMMIRTGRGDFSGDYFGPMEYTGLYWHLVDLVWIYLFPLLYLIH